MVAVLTAAGGLAACSDRSEPAVVTTTTRPPVPETTAPAPDQAGEGAEEPLAPDWVLQVGGAGDDAIGAVAGRQERVVGVGVTAGLTAPAAGGTDALVAVAASADGTLQNTTTPGSAGADAARGIGSAPTGAAMVCGETDGDLGGPSAGGVDGWCGPLEVDGTLARTTQAGSPGDDRVTGAALEAGGTYGFVTGSTDGLYPGAQDPTGRFLGLADALVLRSDADGLPRWARQFGSVQPDAAEGVTTSEDGDALVTGTTAEEPRTADLGAGDAWLARFDPSGNQRWETRFGTSAADRGIAVGVGGQAARGTEVVVGVGSTAGRVPGAGSADESTDSGSDSTDSGSETRPGGPAGAVDALVGTADSSGRLIWNAQFGSPGDDVATGVVVDGTTVYVAGTAGQPIVGSERVPIPGAPSEDGGGRDGFLAALDAATGRVRWIATFGSAGDEQVTGMTVTEDGHLVVSGSTTGQLGATAPAGGTDGFLLAFPLPATGGGAASLV